jgi:hypothetical protein
LAVAPHSSTCTPRITQTRDQVLAGISRRDVAFLVIGALAFEGDLPAALFHTQVIDGDIADWKARSQVIAVFHTNAGHVTLNELEHTPTAAISPLGAGGS